MSRDSFVFYSLPGGFITGDFTEAARAWEEYDRRQIWEQRTAPPRCPISVVGSGTVPRIIDRTDS